MANPTLLDPGQAIKRAFDDASDSFRVELNSAVTLGSVDIQDGNGGGAKATVVPASTSPIATDSALVVTISPNSAAPLPVGSATAAKQDTGNTSLAEIAIDTDHLDANLSTLATAANQTSELSKLDEIEQELDDANTTLAEIALDTDKLDVNLSTLATAANQTSELTKLDTLHTDFGVVEGKQDTGNNSLASIDGKIVAVNTGAVVITSGSVTVSATDLDIRDLVFASDKVDVSGSTLNSKPIGYTTSEFVRNDYTGTPVTSAAYVELIASTASENQEMELFDSSGYTMKIAFGSAGFEIDQFLDYPGGNGRVLHHVPASTRISIKAVATSATAGELCLNLRG